MSTTTESYFGYEANSPLTLIKWQSLNITWHKRFLIEAKEILEPNSFVELNKKVCLFLFCKVRVTPDTPRSHLVDTEYSRYPNKLQTFWEGVIKEYEKENLESAVTTVTSLPDQTQNVHVKNYSKTLQPSLFKENLESVITYSNQTQNICVKDHSKTSQPDFLKENLKPTITTITSCLNQPFQPDFSKKNIKLLNNFCYDIIYELENISYAHSFFEYVEKNITNNKVIKHPMDLFIINSKLKNDEYTKLEEFEEDIRLMFRNCYTYNDVRSEVYCLSETLESVFNKKWNEKLILQDRQTRELKRTRDNDDDDTNSNSFKKQIQIIEQNKNKLVYRQVINDGLLVASAYENLVAGDILPFIKILKTFLLSRSRMSLFSADEPVLQAIVENLLPLKYRIPELSLVMDGKKQKGSGRFGYSDVFVLKEIGDDNNISLELKYISLVGLMKNQKIKFGANDLENLDKFLEKENEEFLLKRVYTYWSKEHQEMKLITINEVLNNGINQLKSYMNIISKGKPDDYFNSGVIDKRIKITKSNPNKLKGFVILVIGFRRILWRPVEELISNYNYDKI
ncbi:hypothetical protein RclHR1_05910008 [Rhizophagus clarus]|uniref:Bromo domain-containing protein n=1 Tax=Rhizophagus clarus TaxID=94130 RepID=A0A2Z6S214_9GLOM|nr:hypothetical protein RclHR1_05910008 [Rhizophagus clarus]